MTGRRNIIIAVGAIVLFAAMVGFFITLDVSPQIAYARLFIDVGLIIGLIAVVMAFYREAPMPLDSIIHALKALQSGKYKTRLTIDEKDPLKAIAYGINDLAVQLELQFRKQEEMKRSLREELLPGIKQKEATLFEHSYHPELGPVYQVPSSALLKSDNYVNEHADKSPVRPLVKNEPSLTNPLLDSNPPPEEIVTPILNKQDQDLGELFQQFIDAQREINMEQIEYPLFLKTIEKTRNDLLSAHRCQGVLFEVVRETDQVALQPRIIR